MRQSGHGQQSKVQVPLLHEHGKMQAAPPLILPWQVPKLHQFADLHSPPVAQPSPPMVHPT
jgi:hypothetical protein